MLWNYSPCIAQSEDPRWGRTYESYGSDLETITKLSTAYSKGLLDGGLVVCAKHFLADGNVEYNTGEKGEPEMLLDRGDAKLTNDEINELLKVYQIQPVQLQCFHDYQLEYGKVQLIVLFVDFQKEQQLSMKGYFLYLNPFSLPKYQFFLL